MARRKRSMVQATSLFPFLSVLAAIIGTLTLIILSVTLTQLARRDRESDQAPTVLGSERLAALASRAAGYEMDIDDLRRRIAMTDDLGDQVATARDRWRALLAELTESDDGHLHILRLLSDGDRLEGRIRDLEGRITSLRAEMSKLRTELDERRRPRDDPGFILTSGGSGVGLVPTFVECTASTIIIHDADPEHNVVISANEIERSLKLQNLFRRISQRAEASIIFLIRPDGVGIYDRVALESRRADVRHGKLPLPGYGRIDFSQVIGVPERQP